MSVPRPWITASLAPADDAALRTFVERHGLRRRERDLDAALEVDPEVEAADDEQQHREPDGDERDDEVERGGARRRRSAASAGSRPRSRP